MERPEKPPGRVRWISPEQADQLIEACNEQLRPLVIFLLYTGARIGEALWLNWSDVDLTRGHVIFPIDPSDGRRTKNNEARGVPLHPRLRAALANLPHRHGEIFRRPDGLPYARLRQDATSASDGIRKAFAGACKRAGIKNFSVHCCRLSRRPASRRRRSTWVRAPTTPTLRPQPSANVSGTAERNRDPARTPLAFPLPRGESNVFEAAIDPSPELRFACAIQSFR
jgi:integrase